MSNRRRTWVRSCLPLLCAAMLLLAVGVGGAAGPQKPNASKQIAGWGTWADPDGDCEVREEKGAVLITVPSSTHDLWPENPEAKQRANAPRLLQDVGGDFAAEVRVSGTVLGGAFFRSGAMLVWQDEKNYVRFERAGSFRGETPRHYCWLHVFKDGKRVVNVQKEPVKDADTILRLVRKSDKLDASFSQDGGKTFTQLPRQDLTLAAQSKVGVAALNASKAPFTVRFEQLKLTPAPDAAR